MMKIYDKSTKLTYGIIKLSVRSTNNAPLFDYSQPKLVLPVIPDGCLIPYIISSFGNWVQQKR